MSLLLHGFSVSKLRRALSSRRGFFRAAVAGITAVLLRKSAPIPAQVNPKGSLPEKSVQLHIYVEVKEGKGPKLQKVYHSAYVPAIRVQDGFLWSRLLRQYDSANKFEIDISFRTEKQRAAWAQSREHRAAWPKIEELGAQITWQGFDVLA